MRWVAPALLLAGVTVVWGGAYLGWRWARRRLGLDGPDAPDMGKRERAARRSLRALLAFELFVVWPLGLPLCAVILIMSFVSSDREMLGPSAAALLGMVFFTVPVPSLIGTVRRLERQRRSGGPDDDPPSFWVDGVAEFIARSQRRRRSRTGR